MKASVSFTDINGLTVSLSVHADDAAFQRLSADSAHGVSTEAQEQSFQKVLEGMPAALLQAHGAISRNLLSAACDVLIKESGEHE